MDGMTINHIVSIDHGSYGKATSCWGAKHLKTSLSNRWMNISQIRFAFPAFYPSKN